VQKKSEMEDSTHRGKNWVASWLYINFIEKTYILSFVIGSCESCQDVCLVSTLTAIIISFL
jgi:hypothetical protein